MYYLFFTLDIGMLFGFIQNGTLLLHLTTDIHSLPHSQPGKPSTQKGEKPP
jgi:hypothetical protein